MQLSMQTRLMLRPRIVPTKQPLSYLDAWKATIDKGGLPDHLLLDRHLNDTAYRTTLKEEDRSTIDGSFPLYARQVFAYTASGKSFTAGLDIVDNPGGHVIPESEVSLFVDLRELSRRDTGLFIEPRDLIEESFGSGKCIRVLPASIRLLRNLRERTSMVGTDRNSGIPTNITGGDYTLEISDNQSLCPIVRICAPHSRRAGKIVSVERNLLETGACAAFVVHDLIRVSVMNNIISELKRDLSLIDIAKLAMGETPGALESLTREELTAAQGLARALHL